MSLRDFIRKRSCLSEMIRLLKFTVPPDSDVAFVNCYDGQLLAGLRPSRGVGFSDCHEDVDTAAAFYSGTKNLTFQYVDYQSDNWTGDQTFDYIVCLDVLSTMKDVQGFFQSIRKLCKPTTRVILTFHSNVWKPALTFASFIGLRRRVPDRNWLSTSDISNLLYLAGFETVVKGGWILLPFPIPGLSWFMNRFLAKLPVWNSLCLSAYIVARKTPEPPGKATPSVSIMVPTRNEKGNMEPLFQRTPMLGEWTELVFVDGNSTDGTVEEIRRCMDKYKEQWPHAKLLHQEGRGKGGAVRQGFAACTGDVLMILDSDLTMPPEELPKYYDALVSGRADVANGCRLVYPQEDKAMRFLNMLANYFFARAFSWLLSQSIKDTLCGTKALWRRDYEKIAANRVYFGDFDPFGDFDLLFGAAKLNLKILDIPVRYKARTYGDIKIDRWRDGMLLFRMCAIAFRRFKLC